MTIPCRNTVRYIFNPMKFGYPSLMTSDSFLMTLFEEFFIEIYQIQPFRRAGKRGI